MKKYISKIILILIATLFSFGVALNVANAARTDGVWQTGLTSSYITTTQPSGFNVLINGISKYLNFGDVSGFSGYGFRDNGGTMEYKNAAGSWAAVGSGGGGGGGITSINTDTTAAQTFVVGTTGADFNILDTGGGNHILNLPDASAVSRGALTPSDWATFSAKLSSIGIGTPVGASVPQSIFYADGSSLLGQDPGHFYYNNGNLTLLSTSYGGELDFGNAGVLRNDGFGNVVLDNTGHGQEISMTSTGAINLQDSTASGHGLSIFGGNTYVHDQLNVGGNYTLPLSDGLSGQFMTTDGAGNLSFATVPPSLAIGNTVGSGTPTDVLFVDSAGNLGQDNQFYFNSGNSFNVGFPGYNPIYVDNSGNTVLGDFYEDYSGGNGMYINDAASTVQIGNDGNVNGTSLNFNDGSTQIIANVGKYGVAGDFAIQDTLGSGLADFNFGTQTAQVGDIAGAGNNTLLNVRDGSKEIDLNAGGSIQMNGATVFNSDSDYTGHGIHNLLDPVAPQDAATMHYVTTAISGVSGALTYYGTWDASLNSPTLASGTGVTGEYYVVSVAGSTTLDGVSTWNVGDWAIFNGTVWERLVGGVTYSAGSGISLSGTTFSIDDTYANSWVPAQTFQANPIFSLTTPGSIYFAGAGGALSENNGNFFWDNTNDRIGLGTTTPVSYIHIPKKTNGDYITLEDTVVGSGQLSNAIAFKNAVGTKWEIGSINSSPVMAFVQNSITLAQFNNAGFTFGTFAASGTGNNFISINGTSANTSGISSGINMTLTNGDSAAGGLTALNIHANGVYAGSGEQLFANFQTVGLISKWKADITGKTTQTGDAAFAIGKTLDFGLGANPTTGIAALASGQVTVSTTAVKSGDIIEVTYNTPAGTLASGLTVPSAGIVPGSSFVIKSVLSSGVLNPGDNSTVNWFIIHTH